MKHIMTGDRESERALGRAEQTMVRSVTEMVDTGESCVTDVGNISIISERLPRGGWATMMARDPGTGRIDYSRQDEEAKKVMVRLLHRKLAGSVVEPGDVAHVVLTNLISESAPEYHVPKMVTEVRAWTVYPGKEGCVYARRLPPLEVSELSPRDKHVTEDLDEELGRLTGETENQPRETFEEFMAEDHVDSFDDDARSLTYEEKLAEWQDQQLRLEKQEAGGSQYMPEDDVRYL
jgi:hypothetical protein